MSKAKEYYSKADTFTQDGWGKGHLSEKHIDRIIEISRLEGVVLGLELAKKAWGKGFDNIYENLQHYKEELDSEIKEATKELIEKSFTKKVR